MDNNRDVNFRINAVDETGRGIRAAEQQMGGFLDRMAMKARAYKREAAQSGENALMRTLNGPQGIAGFATNYLGIGMQAGVTDIIGRQLAQASAKMVDIRNQMNSGELTQGQMIDKTLGEVPIIGGFWQTGRNIREMATGEGAKQAADDRMQEAQQNSYAAMREYASTRTKINRVVDRELAGVSASARIAELYNDPDRQQRAMLGEARRKEIDATQESYRTKRDSLRDAKQKEVDALVGEEKALDQKINATIGSAAMLGYNKDSTPEELRRARYPLQAVGASFAVGGLGEAATMIEQRDATRSRRSEIEQKLQRDLSILSAQEKSAMEEQARKYTAEQAQLEKKIAENKTESLRASNKQALDLQTDYQTRALRLRGDFLAADNALINRQYTTTTDALAKQFDADMKAHGEDTVYAAKRRVEYREAVGAAVGLRDQSREDAAYTNQVLRPREERDFQMNMAQTLLQKTAQNAELFGGASPELRKQQYLLSQEQFRLTMQAQLDDRVRNNPTLKPFAEKTSGLLGRLTRDATSEEAVMAAVGGVEGPLRLAPTELLSQNYLGMAEQARSTNLTERTSRTERLQEDQNKILEEISRNIKAMLDKSNNSANSEPSVFP